MLPYSNRPPPPPQNLFSLNIYTLKINIYYIPTAKRLSLAFAAQFLRHLLQSLRRFGDFTPIMLPPTSLVLLGLRYAALIRLTNLESSILSSVLPPSTPTP